MVKLFRGVQNDILKLQSKTDWQHQAQLAGWPQQRGCLRCDWQHDSHHAQQPRGSTAAPSNALGDAFVGARVGRAIGCRCMHACPSVARAVRVAAPQLVAAATCLAPLVFDVTTRLQPPSSWAETLPHASLPLQSVMLRLVALSAQFGVIVAWASLLPRRHTFVSRAGLIPVWAYLPLPSGCTRSSAADSERALAAHS